ncbi:PadR family transcriptional regulator [Homoserinibacter sp. YIM 151385]|uniref:PadR family transcriptional regulator n=1 Tax=Homoserinibacter sp. YIM 151385 TaxID=2985506 RepID=UPI0022F01690|nr:PadR family transcriptional regulator [Homoserinibacter sp. YIM 151385]WBU37403.1 PadR family transcriptional regulator [Homoserinibacter sp. YIM 151385]
MTPPVFAHGHLRLYLLSLLAERSMHGYELIQALSDRFGGTYVPSAGTIYPRLAKLQDEGLVEKTVDGRKSVYEITPTGRAELQSREHELDGIESAVDDSVRRLADEVRSSVGDAMRSLRADLANAAREARQDARREERRAHVEEQSAPGDARTASRLQLHEAELLLGEFRQELRAELRGAAASATLDREAVEQLREGLQRVRRELLAHLRG